MLRCLPVFPKLGLGQDHAVIPGGTAFSFNSLPERRPLGRVIPARTVLIEMALRRALARRANLGKQDLPDGAIKAASLTLAAIARPSKLLFRCLGSLSKLLEEDASAAERAVLISLASSTVSTREVQTVMRGALRAVAASVVSSDEALNFIEATTMSIWSYLTAPEGMKLPLVLSGDGAGLAVHAFCGAVSLLKLKPVGNDLFNNSLFSAVEISTAVSAEPAILTDNIRGTAAIICVKNIADLSPSFFSRCLFLAMNQPLRLSATHRLGSAVQSNVVTQFTGECSKLSSLPRTLRCKGAAGKQRRCFIFVDDLSLPLQPGVATSSKVLFSSPASSSSSFCKAVQKCKMLSGPSLLEDLELHNAAALHTVQLWEAHLRTEKRRQLRAPLLIANLHTRSRLPLFLLVDIKVSASLQLLSKSTIRKLWKVPLSDFEKPYFLQGSRAPGALLLESLTSLIEQCISTSSLE